MLRLQNKRCIVTGAGHGIGLAIARKFLQEGARVLICDIVPERVEGATEELSAVGETQGITADVSNPQSCDEIIQKAQQVFGGLDVLMNNAGIATFVPFLEHTEDDWHRTISVNLTSMFHLSQRAARVLVSQNSGGAIVNMASTNAHLGEIGLAAYNASKGGVLLLTKTLAVELAPHNIRVNCVSPGHIDTGLAQAGGLSEEEVRAYYAKIPLHRAGQPEEVANAVAFLASDEASFITGESLVIDGGQICTQ